MENLASVSYSDDRVSDLGIVSDIQTTLFHFYLWRKNVWL